MTTTMANLPQTELSRTRANLPQLEFWNHIVPFSFLTSNANQLWNCILLKGPLKEEFNSIMRILLIVLLAITIGLQVKFDYYLTLTLQLYPFDFAKHDIA